MLPLARHRCRNQHVLHGIVGDLKSAVIDVARQRDPTRTRIADRLGKVTAPRNALELLIEPGGQLLEPRFGELSTNLLAPARRYSSGESHAVRRIPAFTVLGPDRALSLGDRVAAPLVRSIPALQ
jgi:hypothetical protein